MDLSLNNASIRESWRRSDVGSQREEPSSSARPGKYSFAYGDVGGQMPQVTPLDAYGGSSSS